MANWSRNPRRDLRPMNAEGVAEGVRGAHRGMRGELTGGYMPQADGSLKAFGTKQAGGGGGNALGGGLSRWDQLNPNAKKAFSPGSPAAGGSRMAAKPAVAPSPSFVDAAMPKPPVPSPVPVRPAGGALRAPARKTGAPMVAGGAPAGTGLKMGPKEFGAAERMGYIERQSGKRPSWSSNPRG